MKNKTPIYPTSDLTARNMAFLTRANAMLGDAEGEHWISTEDGSHIKLDGEGKIQAGMGGKHTGKTMGEVVKTTRADRPRLKSPAKTATKKAASSSKKKETATKQPAHIQKALDTLAISNTPPEALAQQYLDRARKYMDKKDVKKAEKDIETAEAIQKKFGIEKPAEKTQKPSGNSAQEKQQALSEKSRDLMKQAQEADAAGDFQKFLSLSSESQKVLVEASKLNKEVQAEKDAVREKEISKADNAAIKVSIKKAEDKNRLKKHEVATLIGLDGKSISVNGEMYTVSIPKSFGIQDKTLTHNHPSNTTFSGTDLATFASAKLREVRCTTMDGKTFTVRRTGINIDPQFGNVAKKAFDDILDKSVRDAETKFPYTGKSTKESRAARSKAIDDQYNEQTAAWLKEHEKQYGYKYEEA